MLSTFLLWGAAGVLLRVTLSQVLRKQFRVRLAVPPSLASAAIYAVVVLSFLSVLPLIGVPPLPMPLGLMVGFLLPDAVIVRL